MMRYASYWVLNATLIFGWMRYPMSAFFPQNNQKQAIEVQELSSSLRMLMALINSIAA
jgi:hypothetical protein